MRTWRSYGRYKRPGNPGYNPGFGSSHLIEPADIDKLPIYLMARAPLRGGRQSSESLDAI